MAVGANKALDSWIGLPSKSTSAFWMLSLLMPDEVKAKSAGQFSRIELGGGGEQTQLLCGYLGSDHAFGPLLASLPAVLKMDVRATPLGAWVESSFRFAVSQIAAGRVGSTSVAVNYIV